MIDDSVKHIKATHEDTKAWCGHTIADFEFVFKDAEHAAQNGRIDGRLLACTQCVQQIVISLNRGW